jgi:hypothetical protein
VRCHANRPGNPLHRPAVEINLRMKSIPSELAGTAHRISSSTRGTVVLGARCTIALQASMRDFVRVKGGFGLRGESSSNRRCQTPGPPKPAEVQHIFERGKRRCITVMRFDTERHPFCFRNKRVLCEVVSKYLLASGALGIYAERLELVRRLGHVRLYARGSSAPSTQCTRTHSHEFAPLVLYEHACSLPHYARAAIVWTSFMPRRWHPVSTQRHSSASATLRGARVGGAQAGAVYRGYSS